MTTVASVIPTGPETTSKYHELHKPRRVQRQRTKGWRMPHGAIYVGRPTRWGNPFFDGLTGYGEADPVFNVRCFAIWFEQFELRRSPDILEPLKGHDLACWCPLDQPCHADLLLELANSA